MEPEFAELIAVLRMEQIRFASPTAVLARPTGTPMPRPGSARNRKPADAKAFRRPKK
jgi:hypothetical protein